MGWGGSLGRWSEVWSVSEGESVIRQTHPLATAAGVVKPTAGFYGGGSPTSGRMRGNGCVIRTDSLQSAVINVVIHFYGFHHCAATGGADVT